MKSLILRKPSFRFYIVSQCSSIAEFIHQIVIIIGSQHFNKSDDVGMVNFSEYTNLIICEFT